MAYASPDDLVGIVDPVPANASLLLARASRDVDRALVAAVYDPAAPDVIEALRQATVEQVAGGLAEGDRSGLGLSTAPQSFTIGRIAVQRGATSTSRAPRTGGLVDQAYAVLQAAGLTGHPPRST